MTAPGQLYCPLCGQGPYKNVVLHAKRAHDVAADELRERLGLDASVPVASREFRQRQREGLAQHADEMGSASRASAATNREQLRAAWDASAKDATAVRTLAAAYGIGEGSLRDRLRGLGLIVPTLERRGRRALTDDQVLEVRRLYAAGRPQAEIAPTFGVSQGVVSRACTGQLYGSSPSTEVPR